MCEKSSYMIVFSSSGDDLRSSFFWPVESGAGSLSNTCTGRYRDLLVKRQRHGRLCVSPVTIGPWPCCHVVSPQDHRDKSWLASTETLHVHIVQHWIVSLSVELQSHWAWLGPQSSFYKHLSAQYQSSLWGTHVLHFDLKAPVRKIQVKGSIVRNWI